MANHFKIALAAAVSTLAFTAAPASAATFVDCSVTGLDDFVPNAQACVGYYGGNLLKNGTGDAATAEQVTALNLLGLTGTITVLEKIEQSGDFDTLLNGLTWIGVHYGKGAEGPTSTLQGGGTAFYRFDAGTNLDKVLFNFPSGEGGVVSGVALFATGPGGGVPEPATWGLMILGLGAVGGVMRRQRQSVRYSFA